MEDNKRPNRHANPSKAHRHNKGRLVFFRKKNHEVKEILKAMA